MNAVRLLELANGSAFLALGVSKATTVFGAGPQPAGWMYAGVVTAGIVEVAVALLYGLGRVTWIGRSLAIAFCASVLVVNHATNLDVVGGCRCLGAIELGRAGRTGVVGGLLVLIGAHALAEQFLRPQVSRVADRA